MKKTFLLIALILSFISADNNELIYAGEITRYNQPILCNLTCDRMFSWSGFTWCVIGSSETICGPGPNYFSSSVENVYVDGAGDLHLRITKRNGKYYCAELFTVETVGYGTYTFSLSTRVDTLDKNIVLGLFTWNDKNCVTNANSELDVEFTRWGDNTDPDLIEYSVQPTNGGLENERDARRPMSLTGNNSIHFINWKSSLISFSSYKEHTNPPPAGNLIALWSFDNNHIPKSKEECSSDSIIIPSPETETHLDMNLWLTGGNVPSNHSESEVIIHRVEFSPVTLALKVIPEAFYNPVSGLLKRKDSVTVYLRNAFSPYAIIDSAKNTIDTISNSGIFGFKKGNSQSCYIVVKHLNTIETWSKSGGELLSYGLNNYDFTTDSAKAFGKNLKRVDDIPVRYGVYSGDINRDGLINLNDITIAFNDASVFLSGHVRSDVTGDNIVNLLDVVFVYNNSANFVMKITP